MNFRRLIEKNTILALCFLFNFIFCTGMKENQGLKEANKGLDWLVSFIDIYYIDTGVLLENIPLVKFIKTTSRT